MTDPTCYASLQVCALRVSVLDSNGAPSAGAGNGYVSDAMVSVGVSVELEAGADLTQKNGCGAICASFKEADKIKRLNLTLDLCQFDMRLLSMLTEGPLFSLSGDPIGFQYPSTTASSPNGVSLEVWTKAWDGTEQATPSAAYLGGAATYFHWVFPKTTWQMGDVTMEEGFMVVPVTGQAQENSNITADGPYNDWPAAIAGQGGITHVGGVFLDAALPTADCTTDTLTAS